VPYDGPGGTVVRLFADIAVGCVALLHVLFLVLEMFLWTRPPGRQLFGLSREFAASTAALAANQGLYNGFLAAGLVWGLVSQSGGFRIQVFFLCCVIVAGVFGAVTARLAILWVQALPGALALVLVLVSGA
jgi:putative membrane protein